MEVNGNLAHYPACRELLNTEFELSFVKYDSHLDSLSREFQKEFQDFSAFENQFALFSAPFSFSVTKAEESLQTKLLEIQSDSTLNAKFLEVGIPGFFPYLPDRFQNFKNVCSQDLCSVWFHLCV